MTTSKVTRKKKVGNNEDDCVEDETSPGTSQATKKNKGKTIMKGQAWKIYEFNFNDDKWQCDDN